MLYSIQLAKFCSGTPLKYVSFNLIIV